MGRKKNSVALFEVISKSKEKSRESGLGVPKWMGAESPDGMQASGSPSPVAQGVQPPQGVRPPERRVVSPHRAVVEGGRIHLSVNYLTCGVVGAAFIVLLIGAFLLGRGTAGGGGPTKAGLGTMPPLNRDVVPPGGTNNDGLTLPLVPAGRKAEKYYLVIQNLMGKTDSHKAEAFRIAKFCIDKGQSATVCMYRGNYIVWSAQEPMDSPTSETAMEYARKIEALGKTYFQMYRTYDFRQRDRSGRLDPMYIKYRGSGGGQ